MRLIIFFLVMVSSLFGFSGAKKGAILTPQEAFAVNADMNENSIIVNFVLGKDIYVYADSIVFKSNNKDIDATLPKPIEYEDDLIYKKDFEVKIPLNNQNISKLELTFEGCSAAGICYEPQVFAFEFKNESFMGKISNLTNEVNAGNIAQLFFGESNLFILLLFFIFGLFLALTPCVFPMIPILSSILVSQAKDSSPSTWRAFFTSLIYVVAMALTYTAVGVVAGLLGADIQAAMQTPWVLISFSIIFVALALSLFGYYEIALPARWQVKISQASDKAYGKGAGGVAIMGALSALIVGPCVAPPLGGAVLFISQTGNPWLGGLALFVMSIGMGVPLLLVGLGAGKWMPKPGVWMMRISQFFGVLMLSLAIWMLSRILPDGIILLLWALLAIGTAMYMGVFESRLQGALQLIRVFALVILLYGISLFVGFLTGASSMLNPLEKFTTPQQSVLAYNEPSKSDSLGYSVEKLQAIIDSSTKPVIVEFTKDSCVACRELENFTFANEDVKKALGDFTFVKIDVTKNTDDDKKLFRHYGIFGTPNILFFNANGDYMPNETVTGFVNANRFLDIIEKIQR